MSAMEAFLSIVRTVAKLVLGRGVRTSYSQDGEDLLVDSILRKKRGVYVDVGAYHPILYSNTYAFYRNGWRGIVIVPNRSLAPLYACMRSRDRFVNAAIGKEAGELPYHRFKDGAYNTLSEEEAVRWKQENRSAYLGAETALVRPLRDVMKDAGVTDVDFLNIDIEGMDIEALESYDWTYPPRAIAIEDNDFRADAPHESRAYGYLAGRGYILAAFAPRTLIFALPA